MALRSSQAHTAFSLVRAQSMHRARRSQGACASTSHNEAATCSRNSTFKSVNCLAATSKVRESRRVRNNTLKTIRRRSFFGEGGLMATLRTSVNRAHRGKLGQRETRSTQCSANREGNLHLDGSSGWGPGRHLTRQLNLMHIQNLLEEVMHLLHELNDPLDGAIVADIYIGEECETHSNVELSVEIYGEAELQPSMLLATRQEIIDNMPRTCSYVFILQRLKADSITSLPSSLSSCTAFVSGEVTRVGHESDRWEKWLEEEALQERPVWPSSQSEESVAQAVAPEGPETERKEGDSYGVVVVSRNGGKCFLLAQHQRTEELTAGTKKKLQQEELAHTVNVQYALYNYRLRAQLELLV